MKKQTATKLTSEEKREAHNILVNVFSDREMRKMTSLQYQLLAAVFLGVPLDPSKKNGKKFEIKAVIDSLVHLHPDIMEDLYPEYREQRLKALQESKNPKPQAYSGDHHISSFPRKYKDKLKICLNYITYEFYGGNTSKQASHFNNWDGNLIAAIKKIPPNLSKEKKNQAIATIIAQDKFIQSMRGKIGFNVTETKDEIEESAPLRIILEEIKEESSATSQKPLAKTPEELEKIKNFNLAKELFIEALSEDICGNTENAHKLYQQAQDLGYSKKIEEEEEAETELSADNHIRNSTFIKTYLFYKDNFPAKSEAYCLKMAELGVPTAQNEIGTKYYNQQNYEEALKYYKLAEKQGYAVAQTNLGVMHNYGQGVEKNFEIALKFMDLAAQQGFAMAQYYLGLLYQTGNTVNSDLTEAIKLYRLAADQNLPEAQYQLGVMHMNGFGVDKNLNEAVRFYRLAADQGYANAQTNLAGLYALGQGVEKNEQEALRLYTKAAQQGLSSAQYNLGLLYKVGQGMAKPNLLEAARLIGLAAEQGDPDAQFSLGMMNLKGEGIPKNEEEAIRLLSLSAAQGDEKAQNNLGVIYYEKGNKEEALKFFVLAAKQGNKGATEYARELAGKLGVDNLKNIEKAETFFKIAADFGCLPSQFNLGILASQKGKHLEAYTLLKSVSEAGMEHATKFLPEYKEKAALEQNQNFKDSLELLKDLVTQEEESRGTDENRKSEIFKLYTKCANQINAKGENLLDQNLKKLGKTELTKVLILFPQNVKSAKKNDLSPSSSPAPDNKTSQYRNHAEQTSSR